MAYTIDQELDTKGLHCPMPLLKAKLVLNSMAVGDIVRVVATDAGSWDDFDVFIRQSPHELLDREQQDNEFIYCIRKGE